MAAERKVLLAVDEGKTAEHAFDWYVENIHQPNNELIIVHTIEVPNVHVHPSIFVRQDILQAEFTKMEQASSKVKDLYVSKLEDNNIAGRYMTKPGKAGEVIVGSAEEEEAKLIVIGSRGHGTIARAILGSVSSYVLHHAHCPVVIVRKERA